MTDVYECEGQMSIYEFLDKEQEETKWNKWPDKIPEERGRWYELLLKCVFEDGVEFVIDGKYRDKTLIGNPLPVGYRSKKCEIYWRYKENGVTDI